MAYQGPVANVLPYLAARGYVCPSHYNPADYLSTCARRARPLRHARLLK
jgi:hypothetical protein